MDCIVHGVVESDTAEGLSLHFTSVDSKGPPPALGHLLEAVQQHAMEASGLTPSQLLNSPHPGLQLPPSSRLSKGSISICFPGGTSGKEPACQTERPKRCGFHPWVEKILGGGHGSLLQYSCLETLQTEEPGGLPSTESKESNMTEVT